jgi:hypothetical protein
VPGLKSETTSGSPVAEPLPEGVSLIDGVKSHHDNPRTFKIPHEAHKAALKVGDYAKVGVRFATPCKMHCPKDPRYHGIEMTAERFWTIITKVLGGGEFVGEVNNDLGCEERHGLNCGSVINFKAQHVLMILTKEEAERERATHLN